MLLILNKTFGFNITVLELIENSNCYFYTKVEIIKILLIVKNRGSHSRQLWSIEKEETIKITKEKKILNTIQCPDCQQLLY